MRRYTVNTEHIIAFQDEGDKSPKKEKVQKATSLLWSLVYLFIMSLMFAAVYIVYLEYLDYTLSTCETGDRESCARSFETGCVGRHFGGLWWASIAGKSARYPQAMDEVKIRLPSRGFSEAFYIFDRTYAADDYDVCLDITFDRCHPQVALTYYDTKKSIIGTIVDDLSLFPGIRNRLCYSAANAMIQTQGVPRAKFKEVGALGLRVSQSCPRRGSQVVHVANLTFFPVLDAPYITLHFDDALFDIRDSALKHLREGGHADVASIPITGQAARDQIHAGFPTMPIEDIRRLETEGFEFTSHSAYHRLMSEMRPADVFQEAKDGLNMLMSKDFKDEGMNHFVYPYGAESYYTYLVIRRMFLTARLMTSIKPVQVVRGADLHRMVGMEFTRDSIDANLRQIDSLAEFGSGSLHVIFHGVYPDDQIGDRGPVHLKESQFLRILNHIRERRIKLVTVSQLLNISRCSAT